MADETKQPQDKKEKVEKGSDVDNWGEVKDKAYRTKTAKAKGK